MGAIGRFSPHINLLAMRCYLCIMGLRSNTLNKGVCYETNHLLDRTHRGNRIFVEIDFLTAVYYD